MVLDHVAGRAHAVVVSCPAAGADVLGRRDLDMVHVVGVPQRLKQLRAGYATVAAAVQEWCALRLSCVELAAGRGLGATERERTAA